MKIKWFRTGLVLMLFGSMGLFGGTVRKEFRKQIVFESGGVVEVHNTNGTINVESWDQEMVDIFAEIEVKARNRRDAEDFLKRVVIQIDEQRNRLFIEPDYPHARNGGFFDWLFGRKPQVKVTFHIRVPSRTDTDMKSVNGNVRVSEVEGEAKLRTTNGSIHATDIKGAVNAKSTNGSIKVRLMDRMISERMILKTTNGGIELVIPEDVQADISASTVNGSIRTDFPLEVQGKFNSKRIRGRLNGGGSEIELHTTNGGIRILEE